MNAPEQKPCKTYIGSKDDNGDCKIIVLGADKKMSPLYHVVRHSPTGFNWGFAGSGPADTALSILCDHFGERPNKKALYEGTFKAQAHYQAFKFEFITKFGQLWEMTSEQIDQWLSAKQEEEIAAKGFQ